VTWAQLREGRAADPDRWFVDNVVVSRVGDPDPAPFARMHAAFVADHEDEFELYEVIAEQLVSEREMYPEAYRVPGINALALVAGSRRMFTRYLQLTNDDTGLLRSWEAVSRSALHALAAVSAFHAGDDGRLSPVQAQLRRLAAAERGALRELRRSAANSRS
jgi:hypothetical protein